MKNCHFWTAKIQMTKKSQQRTGKLVLSLILCFLALLHYPDIVIQDRKEQSEYDYWKQIITKPLMIYIIFLKIKYSIGKHLGNCTSYIIFKFLENMTGMLCYVNRA